MNLHEIDLDGIEGLPGVPLRPFDPENCRPRVSQKPVRPARPRVDKRLPDLEQAFDACGLQDGSVISFHHHLRNGDGVINAVLALAARRGLRGLTLAASSLMPVHAPLVGHIRSGVVTAIYTGYVNGPVGAAIMAGLMPRPLFLQSHGGRARAISSGELQIDAAFIAAPRADLYGAATGALGRAACGPLGYAMVDADHAEKVVVVSESVSAEPLQRFEIAPDRVDMVAPVASIGNPAGIASGTTVIATDAVSQAIARLAAAAIAASGVMQDGFSFQTGAGGAALASATEIGRVMRERGVSGGFVSGGITGIHTALAREGLFREVLDVQCFDLEAVRSFREDAFHRAMSAAEYASPIHPDPVAGRLSAMVLGAAEIDCAFDVNVTLGMDGRLLGGPGGHPDTAAGARLTLVATRRRSGRYPKIVDQIVCRTTPGRDIDVVVTEDTLLVNPARPELAERFRKNGLPLAAITELATARPGPPPLKDIARPRVLVEYRDGSLIGMV